jgi:hypothetical protein
MKMEHSEDCEMSAYKIQTPGNHPQERIRHSQKGESLNSRVNNFILIIILIQFGPPDDKHLLLETCRGMK